MTSLTLLLVAGGALALLAMLLGVVALARKLDRDSGKTDTPDLAENARAGSLAATLATLAAHAGVQSAKAVTPEKSERPSTAKQIITGMAIFGAVIAVIMGIIAGDG